LSDQHHVPNIPCDRADQHIFLFHHLTYFHKLNAKAATKLIRALIINKDPCEALFHSNDIIVVSNQTIHNQQYKTKRSKKMIPQEKNYSDTILDFSTHYQSLLNAINTSMTKTTNDTLDNSMMPLDCSKSNQPSYQVSLFLSDKTILNKYIHKLIPISIKVINSFWQWEGLKLRQKLLLFMER
ncbi:unnamed protein product, partial [Rotaria sp. Silwood2]